MTKRAIDKVQEFLTVVSSDGDKIYQIVNVELLLKKHPPGAVISFLRELQNDNNKSLKKLIKENASDSRINDVVARNFRIKMAISTIKNYREEVIAA